MIGTPSDNPFVNMITNSTESPNLARIIFGLITALGRICHPYSQDVLRRFYGVQYVASKVP